MKNHFGLFSCVCLILLLSACASFKKNATWSSAKDWEVFYVSPSINQYFFKPLSYEATTSTLLADFTFRDTSQIATVNFSIYSPSLLNTDKLAATIQVAPQERINLSNPHLLFKEKVKKEYHFRYTATIPTQQIHHIFTDTQHHWEVDVAGKKTTYQSNKKTQKSISEIYSNIIVLLSKTDTSTLVP